MPALQIGKTAIEYELRRSKTARERRITVTPERVEVLAPASDLDSDVAAFLTRKKQWIFENVQELRELSAQKHAVPRLMTGSKIPFRGRLSRLTVRRTDGPAVQVDYRNGFLVDLPSRIHSDDAEDVIATELKLWLKSRVRRDVMDVVRAYRTRYGLRPRSVRVADLIAGWGSCGVEGTVCINWQLVFAPKKVLEYAVVHELAHLRHRSHGPLFWKFVEFILPGYAQPKSWLDANGAKIGASFLNRTLDARKCAREDG